MLPRWRVDFRAASQEIARKLLYSCILQREYGVDAAAPAMTQLARLSVRWLSDARFSIGVDDVSPSEALHGEKNRLVSQGYADCEKIMRDCKEGELKGRPGCILDETLETLLGIREEAGQACISEIDPTTIAAHTMALCGSKVSSINISQMFSRVAQQMVGGSRSLDRFFGRALPHFELGINTKSLVTKGFVSNSFFSAPSRGMQLINAFISEATFCTCCKSKPSSFERPFLSASSTNIASVHLLHPGYLSLSAMFLLLHSAGRTKCAGVRPLNSGRCVRDQALQPPCVGRGAFDAAPYPQIRPGGTNIGFAY